MRGIYILLILVILSIALIILTNYSFTHQKRTAIIRVEVEGNGTVLLNSSSTRLEAAVPYVAVLEAEPGEGWMLKAWLVNGSQAGRNRKLILKIGGNTLVKALFERKNFTLTLASNTSNVYVKVNGTLLKLPAKVEASYGDLLIIEPQASPSMVPLTGAIKIRLKENKTITIPYHPIYCSLTLQGPEGFEILVNGSKISLPANYVAPCGSTLHVEAPPHSCLKPRNITITLNSNKTITLKQGNCVCIVSNIGNVTVLVDGVNRTTPYCFEAAYLPVEIEGRWEIPYNETHSWWLGWYWVEEGNRTWWWSYGLNGSRLYLSESANVTLHYVLGLKDLPYVLEYGYWQGEWYKVYGKRCKYWVENGSLIIEGDRGNFSGRMYFKLSEDFGWIAVEVKALQGRFNGHDIQGFGYIYEAGQYMLGVPLIGTVTGKKESLTLLNMTALKELFNLWYSYYKKHWKEWKESVLKEGHTKFNDECNDASNNFACRGASITFLTYADGVLEAGTIPENYTGKGRVCFLIPEYICAYPKCDDLFRLPERNEWMLYYNYVTFKSPLRRMAITIKGVAP